MSSIETDPRAAKRAEEAMVKSIEWHMRSSTIPHEFMITHRKDEKELLSRTKCVLFKTLGVEQKHILGVALPNPAGVAKLEALQKQWGTGHDSFPAMMFIPKGSIDYRVEWAMVRTEDFTKEPQELLASIARHNKDVSVQDDAPYYIRSLQFVYAATVGKWPPGIKQDSPLAQLPAGHQFSS